MTKKKKIFMIIFIVFLFLLGIVITIYPEWSAEYAESVRSEVRTQYIEAVNDDSMTEERQALLEAAIEYNRKLYTGEYPLLTPEENGYYDQLLMAGSNVMCYIDIPAINVHLPVYHGVETDVLSLGAGHMPETSLPVGGENTHAVISAHTGMASSAMFSDLELMKIGDLVYIEVLGERLAYQVYGIETVLPSDVSAIKIHVGQDLLTLVTCTPYGVNTHRLLVHCQRIEDSGLEMEGDDANNAAAPTENDAEKKESIYKAMYQRNKKIGYTLAGCIIAGAMIYVFCNWIRNKRRNTDGKKP